MTMLLEVPP